MKNQNATLDSLAPAREAVGFPSPAQDYVEKNLDLNTLLIKHLAATFFLRAQGDAMNGANIHSGDILIVDRAQEPQNNDIVIACVNGELAVKRLQKNRNKFFLASENPQSPALEIKEDMEISIWGTITYVIHKI